MYHNFFLILNFWKYVFYAGKVFSWEIYHWQLQNTSIIFENNSHIPLLLTKSEKNTGKQILECFMHYCFSLSFVFVTEFFCLFVFTLFFFYSNSNNSLLIQAGDFKAEFPGEIPACRLRNEVREVIYFKQVVQTLRLQHGLKWKTKQNRFLSSKYIFVKSAVMHNVEARVPNIEEIVTWQ